MAKQYSLPLVASYSMFLVFQFENSIPTPHQKQYFSMDLLFCSLKSFFQGVHFLVRADLSVSHSCENLLVLHNMCGFLVTVFRVSFIVSLQ